MRRFFDWLWGKLFGPIRRTRRVSLPVRGRSTIWSAFRAAYYTQMLHDYNRAMALNHVVPLELPGGRERARVVAGKIMTLPDDQRQGELDKLKVSSPALHVAVLCELEHLAKKEEHADQSARAAATAGDNGPLRHCLLKDKDAARLKEDIKEITELQKKIARTLNVEVEEPGTNSPGKLGQPVSPDAVAAQAEKPKSVTQELASRAIKKIIEKEDAKFLASIGVPISPSDWAAAAGPPTMPASVTKIAEELKAAGVKVPDWKMPPWKITTPPGGILGADTVEAAKAVAEMPVNRPNLTGLAAQFLDPSLGSSWTVGSLMPLSHPVTPLPGYLTAEAELARKWAEVYGDPTTPAVQDKIEKTAAAIHGRQSADTIRWDSCGMPLPESVELTFPLSDEVLAKLRNAVETTRGTASPNPGPRHGG